MQSNKKYSFSRIFAALKRKKAPVEKKPFEYPLSDLLQPGDNSNAGFIKMLALLDSMQTDFDKTKYLAIYSGINPSTNTVVYDKATLNKLRSQGIQEMANEFKKLYDKKINSSHDAYIIQDNVAKINTMITILNLRVKSSLFSKLIRKSNVKIKGEKSNKKYLETNLTNLKNLILSATNFTPITLTEAEKQQITNAKKISELQNEVKPLNVSRADLVEKFIWQPAFATLEKSFHLPETDALKQAITNFFSANPTNNYQTNLDLFFNDREAKHQVISGGQEVEDGYGWHWENHSKDWRLGDTYDAETLALLSDVFKQFFSEQANKIDKMPVSNEIKASVNGLSATDSNFNDKVQQIEANIANLGNLNVSFDANFENRMIERAKLDLPSQIEALEKLSHELVNVQNGTLYQQKWNYIIHGLNQDREDHLFAKLNNTLEKNGNDYSHLENLQLTSEERSVIKQYTKNLQDHLKEKNVTPQQKIDRVTNAIYEIQSCKGMEIKSLKDLGQVKEKLQSIKVELDRFKPQELYPLQVEAKQGLNR